MARRRRRRRRFAASAVTAMVALSALTACQVILGIEVRSEKDAILMSDPDVRVDSRTDAGADAKLDADASIDTGPKPCNAGERYCSGACTEVLRSNDHCGACDHRCGDASTCNVGLCTPELLKPNVLGQVVAIDDKEVFYRVHADSVTLSPLMARNKVTGAERQIGSIGRYHSAIVDTDGKLIILDNPTKPRLRRVNPVDGSFDLIYEQQTTDPLFVHFVLDGEDIYFTTRSDVRKVKKDGTGYQVLATITEAQFGAADITHGSGQLFYSIATLDSLWSIPKAGAVASQNRMPGVGETGAIEKIGDKIYWFGGKKLNVFDPTSDGGAAAPLPNNFELVSVAHSMVAKPPFLYVYDDDFQSTKSRIVRINVETNEVLILANNVGDGRLVVDDTDVYFALYNNGGGLFRLPR